MKSNIVFFFIAKKGVSMNLNNEYKDKKPIESLCLSNWGGIEILDIVYGIDDYVVYRFNYGTPEKIHKAKIIYGTKVNSFRAYDNKRYRLDDFIKN